MTLKTWKGLEREMTEAISGRHVAFTGGLLWAPDPLVSSDWCPLRVAMPICLCCSHFILKETQTQGGNWPRLPCWAAAGPGCESRTLAF